MSIPPRLIVGVDRPYPKEGLGHLLPVPRHYILRQTEGPDCGKMTGWRKKSPRRYKIVHCVDYSIGCLETAFRY